MIRDKDKDSTSSAQVILKTCYSIKRFFVSSGWSVCVLPWVGGASGRIQHDQLTTTLKFLGIPKQKWATIIEDTVRTSVEGLAYMHRIMFSNTNQHSTFDTDDPKAIAANQEKVLSVGRKQKIQETQKIFTQCIENCNDSSVLL
jgi:hypothetical protein